MRLLKRVFTILAIVLATLFIAYNFFDGIFWGKPKGYVSIPLDESTIHWQEEYGGNGGAVVGVYHRPSGGIIGYLFDGITIHPVRLTNTETMEYLSEEQWQLMPAGIKVINSARQTITYTK